MRFKESLCRLYLESMDSATDTTLSFIHPMDIGMSPSLNVHVLNKIVMNIPPWKDVQMNINR